VYVNTDINTAAVITRIIPNIKKVHRKPESNRVTVISMGYFYTY